MPDHFFINIIMTCRKHNGPVGVGSQEGGWWFGCSLAVFIESQAL